MDTLLKNTFYNNDFKIIQALITMICIGDEIMIIYTNSFNTTSKAYTKDTIVEINDDVIIFEKCKRRVKSIRLITGSGFDLLDGQLVYYVC